MTSVAVLDHENGFKGSSLILSRLQNSSRRFILGVGRSGLETLGSHELSRLTAGLEAWLFEEESNSNLRNFLVIVLHCLLTVGETRFP